MRARKFAIAAYALAGLSVYQKAFADPLIETSDRLELNWSDLSVHYYGEAQPADSLGSVDFKKAELAARQDSQKYLREILPQIHAIQSAHDGNLASADAASGEGSAAAAVPMPKAKSLNTIYYATGKVRVEWGATMAETFFGDELPFTPQAATADASGTATGVVLELESAAKPRAIYEIKDENGAVLLGANMIDAAGFRKNLMGHWFRNARADELKRTVGASPVKVAIRVLGDGVFVASRADWERVTSDAQPSLRAGKIAVVVP